MTLKSLIPALGFALLALSGSVPSDGAAKAKCDYPCPTDGRDYRDALAAAIDRADRIVVTEHSSPWDATHVETHKPLTEREFVYGMATLSLEQQIQFRDAVKKWDPKTQDWANDCMPVWHHTVRFYEKGQLASTLNVCFTCSHVHWDGIKGVTNPDSMHKGMRAYITSLAMHPERNWHSLAREQLAAR